MLVLLDSCSFVLKIMRQQPGKQARHGHRRMLFTSIFVHAHIDSVTPQDNLYSLVFSDNVVWHAPQLKHGIAGIEPHPLIVPAATFVATEDMFLCRYRTPGVKIVVGYSYR